MAQSSSPRQKEVLFLPGVSSAVGAGCPGTPDLTRWETRRKRTRVGGSQQGCGVVGGAVGWGDGRGQGFGEGLWAGRWGSGQGRGQESWLWASRARTHSAAVGRSSTPTWGIANA